MTYEIRDQRIFVFSVPEAAEAGLHMDGNIRDVRIIGNVSETSVTDDRAWQCLQIQYGGTEIFRFVVGLEIISQKGGHPVGNFFPVAGIPYAVTGADPGDGAAQMPDFFFRIVRGILCHLHCI